MPTLSEWIAITLVVAVGIYFVAIAGETFRLQSNPEADADEIRNANLLLLAISILFILVLLQVYNILYGSPDIGQGGLDERKEIEVEV